MKKKFAYANDVETFFEQDEQNQNKNTNIMVKFDEDGYYLMVCYENGNVLKDYISQEEIIDGLEDMRKENPKDNFKEDDALLCAVGWRLDKFRDDGYKASWLEE
jgi:hypothetical protein